MTVITKCVIAVLCAAPVTVAGLSVLAESGGSDTGSSAKPRLPEVASEQRSAVDTAVGKLEVVTHDGTVGARGEQCLSVAIDGAPVGTMCNGPGRTDFIGDFIAPHVCDLPYDTFESFRSAVSAGACDVRSSIVDADGSKVLAVRVALPRAAAPNSRWSEIATTDVKLPSGASVAVGIAVTASSLEVGRIMEVES